MKKEGSRFCLAVQLLLALTQITLNNGVNHALTARNLDLPRLGDFIMNTNTHTLSHTACASTNREETDYLLVTADRDTLVVFYRVLSY